MKLPFWNRRRRDEDLDEEIRGHLEMAARHRSDQGEPAMAAVSAAQRELGNLGQVKEMTREMWSGASLERLVRELRLALRSLARAPAFAVSAVLVLGLGIGMAVAMFTVFRAVLLRKLPVDDEARLAVMWAYRDPSVEFSIGANHLDRLRHETRTLRSVAGVVHWPAAPFPLLDGDRPVLINRSLVTGNYFDVLGARAALGRLLRPDDEEAGAPAVMVLAYGTWRKQFGADSSVIGKHLIEPYSRSEMTIVGVAPPGLDYPSGTGFWIPLRPASSGVNVYVVARLAEHVDLEAAHAEFVALSQRLAPEFHLTGAHAVRFKQIVVGDVQPALMVLTAAVVLLLLVACVNVGNLLLLRGVVRGREIAVRRALGASQGDIVRHLVAESAVLAGAGGMLGLAVAEGLLRAVVMFAPGQLPRMDDVGLSAVPLGTALVVTMTSVLLFGVLPAVMTGRTRVGSDPRQDSRSGNDTRSRRRIRQLLVVSQVALAVIMLSGAGLLARSLERLEGLDLGYEPDHLAIFSVSVNEAKYDSVAGPKYMAWGEQMVARLGGLPGMTAVTPILIPPFLGANVWQSKFEIEGLPQDQPEANPSFPVESGGPEYFRTFDTPILKGRGFLDTDLEGAPPVVIVSAAAARRLWPNDDPIGKRIRLPPPLGENWPGGTAWRTVVGVAGDMRFRALRDPNPTIYMPWHQTAWQGFFAIRSATALKQMLPAIRSTIHDIDPESALWNAQTMDELLSGPLAQPRLSAVLLMAFALAAMMLAAIGLYGIMASAVAQQTRELGVRLALGATPKRLRQMVLGQALSVAGFGAVAGLVGALAGSRLLTTMLFEVSPTDPVTLVGVSLVLLAVALLAAYLPARQATRIDPARALRAE